MKSNIPSPKANYLETLWFVGSFESDQIGFDIDADESRLTEQQRYDRVLDRPFKLDFLPRETIVTVACGGMHSLVLTAIGNVYSWGVNDCGECGREGASTFVEKVNLPLYATQISCGENHSLAILDNDRRDVYYWGQFRNMDSTELWPAAFTPTLIEPSSFRHCKAFKLSSGLNHALILAADSEFKYHVFGVGDDSIGKLIDTNTSRSNRCRAVHLNLQSPLNAWAVGSSSFYLKSAKKMKLFGWGYNMEHTLGLEHSRTPILKPSRIDFFTGQNIIDIRGGEFFAIFLNSKQQVFACGKNDCGQTGTGLLESLSVEKPHAVELPSGIIKIGAGAHTGFAVTLKGEAYTWGDGSNYVLCNQSEENAFTPQRIDLKLFNEDLIVDIAIAGQHSLILTKPESGFSKYDAKRKATILSENVKRRSSLTH
mmetsp:Transcript_34731/g.61121  ORF Transcript_34731/g.61121 Transcript_34731/m.61121 type:complete len:426 (-) Transcript_34731:17-1294(-)